MITSPLALVLHGGAGAIAKRLLSPERAQEYRVGLRNALHIGIAILKQGGSALDAVTQTVVSLEDSPLFNAAHGAVFNASESIELDASIMDGATLRAGALAGVRTLKNPILGARLVMETSPHVFLIGEGADAYGAANGLEIVPPSYFETEKRRKQLHRFQKENRIALDHNDDAPVNMGTVGAAALDGNGDLAAATSTGGMTNKEYGRVGDSSVIGAGTWASNDTCAVSCTGEGEFFLQGVLAHDVHARMRYAHQSLEEATQGALDEHLTSAGGQGGLIALSKNGEIALPYNSLGMYRASWTSRDEIHSISIWESLEKGSF